jgi:lipoprotein-releasing system ATP-binding protein
MNSAFLAVENIAKTFLAAERRIEVLKDVNLTVLRGNSVGILGVSGTGKSTLLHILGTLENPTEGHIHFEGTDVFSLSSDKKAVFRNRTIGFVFQFHYLLPEFTALENVMMPALIAREQKEKARERAKELLERVAVGHRLEHKPGELSGGEQQRVSIARALMMSPALLLADEPTGNLDPKTAGNIHDLILSLNEAEALTMIIVTHNPDLASRMDRTYTLIDGRLKAKD